MARRFDECLQQPVHCAGIALASKRSLECGPQLCNAVELPLTSGTSKSVCNSLCIVVELPLTCLPAECCSCLICITTICICRVDAAQKILEARFLDLAWAGKEGKAFYPGFLNQRANWPLDDPDGKPMTQALDCKQLQDTLQLCQSVAAARQPAEATSRRRKPSALRTKPPPRRTARQAEIWISPSITSPVTLLWCSSNLCN